MKVTKLEHACLILEIEAKKLVIDPGFYSAPLTNLDDVAAVVVTHVHDDHCSEDQLDLIFESNPVAEIFATGEVRERLAKSRPQLKVHEIHHGDYFEVGPFNLEFFGEMHQEIHRSIPLVQNCGVMVNDELYYPGDSYTKPDRTVALLAVPTSAPWLKIGDVIDFIEEVKPQRAFATHNSLLSETGNHLANSRVKSFVEKHGGTFEYLLPGQSTSL